MTRPNDMNPDRPLDPEWLAAYADGELDADPSLGHQKERVEAWLTEDPEAVRELHEQQRLKELWKQTVPPEPGATAWEAVGGRIAAEARAPGRRFRPHLGGRWLAFFLATAAAIVWICFFLFRERPVPGADMAPSDLASVSDGEIFEVASTDEIEILSVEGADTGTLAVGDMPVQGPLELLAPGEVTLTSIKPAARDNMIPEIHLKGPVLPMIWARLDTER
jgi:hypothetical protein